MTTMSASATAVTVGALATYRLTRLITTDTITEPLREMWWRRFPPETSKLGYIPTCDHCSAVYAAAGVTALAVGATRHAPRQVQFVSNVLIATLALSGAVSLYHDHQAAEGGATGWAAPVRVS